MAEKIVLQGRGLVDGIAEGEALVSAESLVWSHGVYPPTGMIEDVRVSVCGECVKDKILVYPYGKGSTTGGTWMLENSRYGNAPKAIINRESEMIIAAGAVLSKELYGVSIPLVDHIEDVDKIIETGDWVRVDGFTGTVEVTKKTNAG